MFEKRAVVPIPKARACRGALGGRASHPADIELEIEQTPQEIKNEVNDNFR